jgi:exo-beta-1,3-glucanase (GH17 family)
LNDITSLVRAEANLHQNKAYLSRAALDAGQYCALRILTLLPRHLDRPIGKLPRRTGPIAFRTPLALLLISLCVIAVVWWRSATPYVPIDPAAKLDCVAYAPFRGKQTPRTPGLIISPEQIAEDLAELAKISQCVRTYSVDNGLDKVPELASRVGLKVLLGVWIGSNRPKNALLVDTAISLTKEYPGVITAIIVGSEVLLRGEMTALDLREIIRAVKTRVNIPVTYADVWEFWLRYREVSDDVDFVTVHMLPYWEDLPPRAEDAAAHVDAIRKRMAIAFPGKEILIGETGWPSKGRMRDGALPSRINQARFYSGILDRAKQENFRVILFEAYDEPWKRQWEGTVGGYWGLFDEKQRTMKYPPGAAINNYPFWKLQLGCGLALSISVFGAALLTLRRRSLPPRSISWVAVAVSATVGGILLGVSAENMFYQSYGLFGWLGRGLLLAAGIAAPLLSSNALMSGRALPTFLELIGPRETRTRSLPTMVLGFTLTVTALIAAETALSFVFDPRWRDFPFAGLTMAAVPFWTLTLLNRPKSGTRPVAEAVFTGLFAVAALYITINEGPHNWQALWTSAAYLLFGATLWQARSVAVAGSASAMPVVLSEVVLFGKGK